MAAAAAAAADPPNLAAAARAGKSYIGGKRKEIVSHDDQTGQNSLVLIRFPRHAVKFVAGPRRLAQGG